MIGLREGLEAALIVSILVAYLVKMDRRDRLAPVGIGVGVAIAVSVAFGALLTFTSSTVLESSASRETFGGVLSIVAVGFVTWMIFWMRRAARGMRAELDGRMGAAMALGAGAIVATAFIAVAREGLETALFFWSAVQAAGSTAEPVAGFTLGVVTAVALAWLFYRRSINLNLARFFTWTGAALVVVAAGVLSYGVHDLQEGGVIGGLGSLAFDLSAAVPPSSWYGTLLKGTVNFTPQTTIVQAVVWAAYMAVVLPLFLLHGRAPSDARDKAEGADPKQRSNAAKRGAVTATVVVVAVFALVGCGDSNGGSTADVTVTATDSTCKASTGSVAAGSTKLAIKNDGSTITEVYVYGANDKVIGEVENIGPATSRDLTVKLEAGNYEIACKPGMTGSGIRTPLTVTR